MRSYIFAHKTEFIPEAQSCVVLVPNKNTSLLSNTITGELSPSQLLADGIATSMDNDSTLILVTSVPVSTRTESFTDVVLVSKRNHTGVMNSNTELSNEEAPNRISAEFKELTSTTNQLPDVSMDGLQSDLPVCVMFLCNLTPM
jgi:hypothetical protein